MDNPFTQDTGGFAFQQPYQPQDSESEAPANGALRPFTAVDIAPKAVPSSQTPLGPSVSPFLENFKTGPHKEERHSAFAESGSPVEPPHQIEPAPEEDFVAVAMPRPIPAPAPTPAAPKPKPEAGGPIAKPRFFLTSTTAVDGHAIQAYLDVISVEIVLPKDVLFRNPAPYGELHRLRDAEDQLQKIKAKALEELSEKARGAHADGVIGVTVTFVNLDTVCCLCSAVGTAVRLV